MKVSIRAALAALAFLAASCTTIKEGVVVSKGYRKVDSNTGLGPVYWVELRGTDAQGQASTQRVVVFEKDWRQIKKGQHFTVPDYLGQSGEKPGPSPTPEKKTPKAKIAASTSAAETAPGSSPGSFWQKLFGGEAEKETLVSPHPPRKQKTAPKAASATKPESAIEAAPLTDAQKETRYREVQAKAMEDRNVREWKEKAHAATTDEQQQNAMREYRKALFDKMRQLDTSLKDRIDQAEAGTLKQ